MGRCVVYTEKGRGGLGEIRRLEEGNEMGKRRRRRWRSGEEGRNGWEEEGRRRTQAVDGRCGK